MGDVLGDHDATGIAELVRAGDVHPVELVDAAIDRIEEGDAQLNSVIHRQFERARREAAGPLPDGPFRGVPFLLKDIGREEAGERHHQGMRALREVDWRATADSELALAFRACGLIPVGRTNVPELALMGTTEPDAYGPTHNPWNLAHSPGGSSGGSAAAVAAGFVPAAHANDIAGSIRIPASQCGLVGLKPTRGRVLPGRRADPAVGMNTEGVVTRTIRDTAGLLDAITDRGRRGPWPAPDLPGPLIAEVGRDPGRLRVGVCVEASANGSATGARSPADHRLALKEVDARARAGFLHHRCITFWAPIVAFFARNGTQNALSSTKSRQIDHVSARLAGTSTSTRHGPPSGAPPAHSRASSCNDAAASAPRRQLARALRAFTGADVEEESAQAPRDADDLRDSLRHRVFNATGQPALSLPLGWPADGLPRGVQFIAACGREDVLIRLGAQLELVAPWAQRRPPMR
jgi:amidase